MTQPTPETATRPITWFKPDERELVRHDDPEKVRLRSSHARLSIERGWRVSVPTCWRAARPGGTVMYGERR
jgi:hypothetical protein